LKKLKEMSKKDIHIEETLEKLTELAHGYQRALECTNHIISMKNRYIELCEMETELHIKENVRLQSIVFWLSICLGAVSVGSLLLYIL
jgi:hypothetical protein